MNSEVIKSFLVGLGFEVDSKSLADFNAGLKSAALRVTAVATAITGMYGLAVKGIQSVSEGFEEMGYQYHIIAPAINKMIVLRQEMMKAYGAAGINIRKVIVESIKLNMSIAKTKFALEAIYKSTASKFFPLLLKQSDAFRKKLYDAMPAILATLEKMVKFVFKAFEAITQLGVRLWSILGRIFDFFVMLDAATDGWSTIILGVVAAWQLLNLSFLATPLGALLTGFVALLALFDDFKTWQEGGKSLFNWTPFLPVIDAVTKELTLLKDTLDGIFTTIFNIGGAVVDVFQGKWGAALDRVTDAWGGLKQAASNGWDASGSGIDNVGSAAWGFGKTVLGGQQGNSGNNVNAKMQTSITINGSPNADATARLTAQQQQGVNRDFARNMKGATR